ncbi:MAG: cysteine desulfurase family protein [Nitrososphaeraceae archaeon]|nr:cysteine desulfurase family protein [Nitrososphaeraceae archaeon]
MTTQKAKANKIYLDNAASTPIRDEVFQEMIPYLTFHYGNPSSLHAFGFEANRAINKARKHVASIIGAKPSEIIFTASGTEADNMATKGVAYSVREKVPKKNHIITTSIEHDAVMESCRDLERNGFEVSYLPVSREGLVDAAILEDSISKEKTSLVSIMLANNEIGTLQPINELVKITRRKAEDVIFHTDAIQALGKIPINCEDLGVDLMALSSHKINGPKGVGCLYIKEGSPVNALISGGGQEKHLRSGTENVHGIVGFGKACDILKQNHDNVRTNIIQLRDYLVGRIVDEIPMVRYNGPSDSNIRLPNIAHFTFFGLNGEDLLIKLDEHGVAASTGSACSARKQKESHVLRAMGFTLPEISGSLRLSLGPHNTIEEVDQTVAILKGVIEELLEVSPFKHTT